MSPQTDQMIGGLTMWIPAAMTEVIGLLVALRTLMRLSAKGRWGMPKARMLKPEANKSQAPKPEPKP
jgi:putative membrane protein